MGALRALAKISEIASALTEGRRLGKAEKGALLTYLQSEGRDPAWADVHPGVVPTRLGKPAAPLQIAAPKQGETWYRGGPAALKLQSPIFTTRDPEGAAWYAAERSPTGIGAVGEYEANVKQQPARLRDLYRVGLSNNLEDIMAGYSNPLDWTYNPDFRAALTGQGYDSALANDMLERDEIEALVGLSPDIFTPKARSIVAYDSNPIFERTGKTPLPFGETGEYVKFGETRPWTKKAKGGVIRGKIK